MQWQQDVLNDLNCILKPVNRLRSKHKYVRLWQTQGQNNTISFAHKTLIRMEMLGV